MNDLIGKKFKRNKYGLSIWTDEVRTVEINWLIQSLNRRYYRPLIYINGVYALDEVVFII